MWSMVSSFETVANSAYKVDVLVQNSMLAGSRRQALILGCDGQAFRFCIKLSTC